jgi:hypothetical protein
MPSDITGLMGILGTPQTPAAHKTTHENGGTDEISVSGLSGLLADPQTPAVHAVTSASHSFPGGTTFLKADGTWATPAGGGGGVSPFVVTVCGSGVAWTNQPAGVTELFGGTDFRTKVDLTNYTQVRMTARVGVVGAATAVLRLQYSTDEAAWVNLTSNLAINATGVKASAWENLPAGAKADVFIRVVGEGGNAAADPRIGTVTLQVK